jgi:hypothetical protein
MQGFVHSTGFAPELLYPGLAAIWGQSYGDYDTKYTKFFQLKKSSKRFEKEQEMSGFTLASVKDEGDSVDYARLTQGFQKEYNHTTYGLGAIITRELMEDDQYNVIQKVPSLLAGALRRTEERVAHNVLDNGFDAAFTGADGVQLFSTAHPNSGSGGGTQSNTAATAADLTETALEAAVIAVRNFRDANNQRISIEPKKLVVSNFDFFNASKILKTKQKVGTADNDINMVAMMDLELIASSYLTDPDAWFVVTNAENGLTFYRRREATIERDNDISTQNLAIVTTTRFDAGWTDWRGAWASPGA